MGSILLQMAEPSSICAASSRSAISALATAATWVDVTDPPLELDTTARVANGDAFPDPAARPLLLASVFIFSCAEITSPLLCDSINGDFCCVGDDVEDSVAVVALEDGDVHPAEGNVFVVGGTTSSNPTSDKGIIQGFERYREDVGRLP